MHHGGTKREHQNEPPLMPLAKQIKRSHFVFIPDEILLCIFEYIPTLDLITNCQYIFSCFI